MSVESDLRAIASEALPVIEQWLKIGEQIAAFRDTATEKGIEWSNLKAVLVARAKDNQDGGERVKKLLNTADKRLSYADMLLNLHATTGNKISLTPVSAPAESAGANILRYQNSSQGIETKTASTNSPVSTPTPSPIPEQTEPVADDASSPIPDDGGFLGPPRLKSCASNAEQAEPDDEFNRIPNFLNRAPVDLVSV